MNFLLKAFYIFIVIICISGGQQLCHAQKLLEKKITLEVKNKPLKEVMALISKQGGFYFSYNSSLFRPDSLVTVTAKNKSIKSVLVSLLGEQFQLKETDNHIIIQQAEKEKWFTISGYITDIKTGERVSEASVVESQQLVSTLTDAEGHFKLRLKDKGRYEAVELRISKGFYTDTLLSLSQGFDQEYIIPIAPADYALPGVTITQFSQVEKSWWGKFLLSSQLRKTSANLSKFFVDKPVQVSLIPGLGTHGQLSSQVVNKYSLNVLGGYTAGVDGVEVGGLFNINKKDMRYVQTAGLFNVVAGKATGAQVAGFSNYINNKATGAQCAGFMNKAGSALGAQVAGFANIAFDSVTGAQAAGFINTAEHIVGAQTAGFINISNGVVGAQTAGFINIADSMNGAQTAGFINIADRVDGMQTAGFINIADSVAGMQMAGFINIADRVKGMQLAGFINISNKCTTPFAFINIVDSTEFPIGIINIVKNGDCGLGLSVDETSTYMLTLRSGGRILYGIIGVGVNGSYGSPMNALEIGLGAHLPITKRFRVQCEVAGTNISNYRERTYLNNSVRLFPSFRVGPLEAFAGPCFSYAYYTPGNALGADNTPYWNELPIASNRYVHGLRLGFKAGIQVHL